MSIVVEFLPMAAELSANVDSQASYAGAGYQVNGFQPGITLSSEFNKGFRQGTVWSAVIANFVSAVLSESVLDSGYSSAAAEVAALQAQFQSALTAFITGSGFAPSLTMVAFSTTPVFNCALGNVLTPAFQIALTGSVTNATASGTQPGQLVTIIVIQPAGGGCTFVWGSNIIGGVNPDPTPNSVTVFTFEVDSSNYLRATGAAISLAGINSTPIGVASPAAGNFTTLNLNGAAPNGQVLTGNGTSYVPTTAPGYTSGNNSNGYWVSDPSGKITQWGSDLPSGGAGGTNHTFPTPFTNAASVAVVAMQNYSSGPTIVPNVTRGSVTTTGWNGGGSGSSTVNIDWIATGY